MDEVVSTVRIGSIKEVLRSTTPVISEEKVEESEVDSQEEEQEWKPITDNLLREVFNDLASEFKAQKKMTIASYLVDPVIEITGNAVTLFVGSKMLGRELDAQIPLIVKKCKIQGCSPEFNIVVNVQKFKEYKVFTPKEEFEALASKNPILKQFEERFGLDFDV